MEYTMSLSLIQIAVLVILFTMFWINPKTLLMYMDKMKTFFKNK